MSTRMKTAAAIDDIVSRDVLQQLRRDPPPVVLEHLVHRPNTGKSSKSSDELDIVSSMAKRLSALEKDLKDRVQASHRLQAENDALKAKLKAAEEEAVLHRARPLPPVAAPHGPSAASSIPSHPTSFAPPAAAAPSPLPSASFLDPAGGSSDALLISHLREETTRLRAQVRHAWSQVAEMKKFLSDYGMVWVGDDGPGLDPEDSGAFHDSGAGPSATSAAPSSQAGAHPTAVAAADPAASAGPASASPSSSSLGPPCEMSRLMAAVEELNQLAGDGCGQLVGDGGAAGAGPRAVVLRAPDAVRLVLFKDGLQVHRSPPVPYDDPSARGILQDVLDGYFPYVLKFDFPDGVPIKLIDRTSELRPAASSLPAALAAAASSSASKSTNSSPMRGSNIRTFHDIDEAGPAGAGAGGSAAGANPLSKQQDFLNRLPQTVIKNGLVVGVRGEVGRRLGVGGPADSGGSSGLEAGVSSSSVIATPADALLTTSQRSHAGPTLPPPSREGGRRGAGAAASTAAGAGPSQQLQQQSSQPQRRPDLEIASLQVKSEDGRHTYVLHLQYDDTIAGLRKCIDAHRAKSAGTAGPGEPAAGASGAARYEIRSAFPARAYADGGETLRAAGLVPNATLFLRALA